MSDAGAGNRLVGRNTTSAAYRLTLPTRSPVALNIPSNGTDCLRRRHGHVLVTGPAGSRTDDDPRCARGPRQPDTRGSDHDD